MKKVMLVISLVAWCAIQHFDLISRTYGLKTNKVTDQTFKFDFNSFPEHSKFMMPKNKVFYIKPIKIEERLLHAQPGKPEHRKGSIRISAGTDENSEGILFSMLKS